MSSFQLFKCLQYHAPYYFFLYGLYRTAFIRQVMRTPMPCVPGATGGDIMLCAQIALATRVRYRDEVLHIRTETDLLPEIRYPDDECYAMLSQMESSGQWNSHRQVLALMRHILQSHVVPWHRKVKALSWLAGTHLDGHLFPRRSPIRWLHQLLKPRRKAADLTAAQR
jgi:hypothetical protein